MTPTTETMAQTPGPVRGTGVAERLAEVLAPFVGGDLPVRLRAWDGSEAGSGPAVVLNSPRALTRLLWSPGELGAAQAYVTGELEVPGDLREGLTHVRRVIEERGLSGGLPGPAATARALWAAARLGVVATRPEPPASQIRVTGRLHSKNRDRDVIGHHYDLSNAFYAAILDQTMAYSCGYFTDPSMPLVEAQRAKLSLICRKLGLERDSRLLDIGCGWGSLTLHAAAEFGARVTAITISAEQHAFVTERVAEAGLTDRVEVRLQDYRDATGSYDAVSSIEMGEHVGAVNYPTFVEVLHRSVRPGGRVLIQQMSRPGAGGGDHPGGGPFIEAFIAPDMTMRPVGETVALLEDGGLEVRDVHALREHYVHTVEAWIENFAARQDELRAQVPEEVLRVWWLYLVGGAMAFRDGRMGVDQILAVRPGAEHGLSAVRQW